MKPRLSYTYVGERFPEHYMKDVIVGEIAQQAGISYQILKNRMGMKKTRGHAIVITDDDLLPKKRVVTKVWNWKRKERPVVLSLSQKWLRKPII
ncbi:MAG: hypothetical protein ACI9W7_000843 [Porticoccaceae bacterium]|jgi:hypothetical protein|tara:strand:- start:297 stop:578 length:282 start_codon:yes stop_codon:yes gene_type:complete